MSKSSFVFLLLTYLSFTLNAQTTTISHEVVEGDTWYSISKKYGVEIVTIQQHNNIEQSDFTLQLGTVLKILQISHPKAKSPEPEKYFKEQTHKVQKGETLYSISKKYIMNLRDLQRLNKITFASPPIKSGQKLKVKVEVDEPVVAEKSAKTSKKERAEKTKVQKAEKTELIVMETKIEKSPEKKTDPKPKAKGPKEEKLKLVESKEKVTIEKVEEDSKSKEPKAKEKTTKEKLKLEEKGPVVIDMSPEELKIAGQKVHTVAKGETLYSIAKQHDMSVKEVSKANQIKDNNLKIGRQLLVNDKEFFEANAQGPELKPETHEQVETSPEIPEEPTYFEIVETETVNVEEEHEEREVVFVDENTGEPTKLEMEELAETKPKSVHPTNVDASLNNIREMPKVQNKSKLENAKLADLRRRFEMYERNGIQITSEQGISIWYDDKYGYGQDNYFALHHTASMGHVLMVKNLMNGRTVFVKVIGRLPKIDQGNNTIMKLSYAAAEELNFIDEKVQVEVQLPVRN